MMDSLTFRQKAFNELGKSRIKRIAVCSLAIAAVWCLADFLSGSLSVNLWHDLLCLGLGVLTERLIPWGDATHTD